MNILIYGEAVKYGVAFPLARAFEELGHRVTIFDWPKYLYTSKGFTLTNRLLDRVMFFITAAKINRDLTGQLLGDTKFDLMVVIRGNHIAPATVGLAKSRIAHVVNWNSDDFFNPLNSSWFILEAFDKYDCIFTSRGHLRDEYLQKGAKRFETLNWYYRPDVLLPRSGPNEAKYTQEIAFIGSWSPRREAILGALQSFDLKIWGAGWGKAEAAFRRQVPWGGQIHMDEMMKVMRSSKLNLNLLTKENRDTSNIRNFEIPSAGGFQLCERSPAVTSLFAENEEIACFEGIDELLAKCRFYLNDDVERERIAEAGQRRLFSGGNSIVDRAKQILAAVGLLPAGDDDHVR
jgi:spore maturation protein CgeB